MEWLLLAVAVVGLLFFTARRKVGRDLIAKANQVSAELRTPAAREEFKTATRLMNDLELEAASIMFGKLESELGASESRFAALNDAANLAETQMDLAEVRLRNDWLREEWLARRRSRTV